MSGRFSRVEYLSIGRLFIAAVAAGAMLLSIGCGGSEMPTGSVQGRVTFPDGRPSSAVVQIYSAETGVGTAAAVGGDGTFRFDGEVPVGTYRVAIMPPEPPPPGEGPSSPLPPTTIPSKYRSEITTPLTAQVNEGENEFAFELVP